MQVTAALKPLLLEALGAPPLYPDLSLFDEAPRRVGGKSVRWTMEDRSWLEAAVYDNSNLSPPNWAVVLYVYAPAEPQT